MTNREISLVATLAETLALMPMLLVTVLGMDTSRSGLVSARGFGMFVALTIQMHICHTFREWVVAKLSKGQKRNATVAKER